MNVSTSAHNDLRTLQKHLGDQLIGSKLRIMARKEEMFIDLGLQIDVMEDVEKKQKGKRAPCKGRQEMNKRRPGA